MSAFDNPNAVTVALVDLVRAARHEGIPWALVGGYGLVAHRVPRSTQGLEVFASTGGIERLADRLVGVFGWIPLGYNEETGKREDADEVGVYLVDDPVLADVGEQRQSIPLHAGLGLTVRILAAQHPVEQEMIAMAVALDYRDIMVPVAPLGGILFVKMKAGRTLDLGAIEQVAEHTSRRVFDDAIAWARQRDAAIADELQSIVNVVEKRLTPIRMDPPRKQRPR